MRRRRTRTASSARTSDDAGGDPPVVADDEVVPEAPECPHVRISDRLRGAQRAHGAAHEKDAPVPQQHEQGEVAAGPFDAPRPSANTPSPSTAQKVPKVVSSRPTANLIVFSGTRASGRRSATPAASTTAPPHAAPAAASGIASALSPNVITMKTISSPSRKTPLKLTTKREPVEPEPRARRRRARGRRCSVAEDLLLVVQRLEPRGAQDRLAQPLQAEDQQQRADDQLQQRSGNHSTSA